MAGAGLPDPELGSLRGEVEKIRNEIFDERVERAAKHVEMMRNWLGVYTLIVSTVLVGFGVLGWRGLSDIDSNKAKVEAASSKVGEAVKGAETSASRTSALLSQTEVSFQSLSAGEKKFKAAVEENDRVVRQNRTILSGFKGSLAELEAKHKDLATRQNDLKAQEDKFRQDLVSLTTALQETSSSVSSSLVVTNGLGGLVSTSLNVPVITSVFSSVPMGTSTVGGYGFGPSPGRVLYKLAPNSTFGNGDLATSLDAKEVPTEMIQWSENTIICRETLIKNLPSSNSSESLLIQVVSVSGTKIECLLYIVAAAASIASQRDHKVRMPIFVGFFARRAIRPCPFLALLRLTARGTEDPQFAAPAGTTPHSISSVCRGTVSAQLAPARTLVSRSSTPATNLGCSGFG